MPALNKEALRQDLLAMQQLPLQPKGTDVIELALQNSEGLFNEDEALYALKQAIDAHLVDGKFSWTGLGPSIFLKDITPEGHNFIDSLADPSHWQMVKDELKKQSLPVTVATIAKIITSLFL